MPVNCNSRSSITGDTLTGVARVISGSPGRFPVLVETQMRCNVQLIVAICVSLSGCAFGQSPVEKLPAKGDKPQNSVIAAAKQTPDNLSRVRAAGAFCLQNERWVESVYWFSRAYKLSHSDFQIGYELAFAQIQAGDFKAADQQLQDMSAGTDAAKLHSLRGLLKERTGDLSGAAHEYYHAVELDPSEDNLFELANFLLQHKKYSGYLEESVKFFQYGVSKFPESAKMRVGFGVALYASEEYDEAIRVLCEAVDLAPNDPKPVTFLGMARRVSPELAQQVDERLQVFTERYPDNPAANYEYAVSLWDRKGGEEGKNQDEIEKLLEKAIAKAPQWFEPHYQLGLLYESQARYVDAVREMQRACALEPAFKPAHFRLAGLYKRIGDRRRAGLEATKAKELDKDEIDSSMFKDTKK